jgi:hypothetical protein
VRTLSPPRLACHSTYTCQKAAVVAAHLYLKLQQMLAALGAVGLEAFTVVRPEPVAQVPTRSDCATPAVVSCESDPLVSSVTPGAVLPAMVTARAAPWVAKVPPEAGRLLALAKP